MKPLRISYSMLLVICMLNIAGAQGGPEWIPFDPDRPDPAPPSAEIDRGRMDPNTGVHIDFNIPGMYVERVAVAARGGEDFDRLFIPMGGTLQIDGNPEVPMVTKVLEVPMDAMIKVDVVSSAYRSHESYNVYPAQPDRPRQDDPNEGEEEFVINEEVYRTDKYYPGELAEINLEDDVIIRGHRIVYLRLYPVQFNPVTRTITSYSNVGVQLTWPDPNIPVEPPISPLPIDPGIVRGQIIEYENVRFMGALGARGDETKIDYLILTPETFYNADDPNNPIVRLADWKRRKGYRTRVATIKENVTSQDIEAYLQTIYNSGKPDDMLKYVLLVGDTGDDTGRQLVPTNYKTTHPRGNEGQVGTDLYYATLDGSDYHPDLLIGRLSVDTIEQAEVVIDKILAYERNLPALQNFYSDVSLVALFEDEYNLDGQRKSDGQEDDSFRILEFAEEIRDFLEAHGYAPERIYDYSGNASSGPQKYEDGTELPSYLKLYQYLWDGDTSQIQTAVESGCFLVVYDGHGSRTSWGQPRFDIADIMRLGNGSHTPVVLSFACLTGWYDNETDSIYCSTSAMDECFCEHFLRQPNGGAVGIIGSSRTSYSANDELMKGMISALWPNFNPQSCDLQLLSTFMDVAPNRLGLLNEAGKACMKEMTTSRVKLHFEMYNLLGDPEMPIWTRKPENLRVQQFGSRSLQDIEVEVVVTNNAGAAVEDAVVVLMCGDTAFRQETDANGYAFFNLDKIGTYEMTITALNFWPHESTILVN